MSSSWERRRLAGPSSFLLRKKVPAGRRRSQEGLLAASFLLLVLACYQPSAEQIVLRPGAVFPRSVHGKEPHGFRFDLPANQLLRLDVDQRGADVAVLLKDSKGRLLYEVDTPNGRKGLEPVVVVTPAAGSYLLIVEPLSQDRQGGYALKVREVRPARERDRICAAAATAWARAERRRLEGDFERAASAYREALGPLKACGERRREAQAEWRLGEMLLETGELRRAAAVLEGAAADLRRLGDDFGEAGAWNDAGKVRRLLGEPGPALAAYQGALRLYREAASVQGEAATRSNIGLVYVSTGNFQEAIHEYGTALALWRHLGIRSSEATLLQNLGMLYARIGHDPEALDLLQQAVDLAAREEDEAQRISPLMALGWAQHLAGRPEAALERYKQALALVERTGDRGALAAILDRRGTTLKALHRYGEAADSYSRALAVSREQGSRVGEGSTLANLGWLDLETGAVARGRQRLRQARELLAAAGDPNGQVYALVGSSRAERLLGDFPAARQHAEAAVRLVEDLRAGLRGSLDRGSFLATRFDAYEELVTLLMELDRREPAKGHDREALQVAERARARNLAEEIALDAPAEGPTRGRKDRGRREPLTSPSPPLPPHTHPAGRGGVQKDKSKTASLLSRSGGSEAGEEGRGGEGPAAAKTYRGARASAGGVQGAAAVRAEIAALEERRRALANRDPHDPRLRDLDAALRARSLEADRLAAAPAPRPAFASLAEVQALADADTTLVYYQLAEPASFAWTVDRRSIVAHRLPGRERIERIARRLIAALPHSHESGSQQATARAARELSDAVLAPLGKRLAGRRLVILADGALHLVPFGALPVPGRPGEPLLVQHEIAAIPSATVLRSQRQRLAGRHPAPGTAAVLADPVFSWDDDRLAGAQAAVRNAAQKRSEEGMDLEPLRRLKHTAEEAEAIRQLVPRKDLLMALGTAARRDLVLSGALRRYRILCFATHGLLDPVLPERSGVVLSRFDATGKRLDGFLSAPDVAALDLPAELAVLSACQTALGRELRGEGLVGLTQAFFRAGVRGVVVSYWSVDDRATAALMARFYRGLLVDRLPPSAALRAAQLAIRGEKGWGSPYFWAGFAFHGDWKAKVGGR